MIRHAVIAAVILSLQGCAMFGWNSEKSINIVKKSQERTPLNLPDPAPLRPTALDWVVITPENSMKVWEELKKRNADLVLFGITSDGYETLATDTAQTRNFISQQRELLNRYREYYEPKKSEETKQP